MRIRNIILTVLAVASMVGVVQLRAEKLVLVTTNDTHSQIDPTDDDNLGGVLRRKVVIDSIREANPNVLLIDLGDVVQGTLYFNNDKGDIENRMMNELGYDIRILGNHEFDNGVDELARTWRNNTSVNITTNYDLSNTPLKDMFERHLIKQYGDKRVGFLGINLQPKGMISEGNYDGVEYIDAMKAANMMAWYLKNYEKCDMVIALTHIGYPDEDTGASDTQLAAASEDIDIILGGHSHTIIDTKAPNDTIPWILPAADGDSILVTQAGKSGKYVGVVEIDLDDETADYRLIRIDSRLDSRIDPRLDAIIEPYRQRVDSIMRVPVSRTRHALEKDSPELSNWVADFIRDRGSEITGAPVDFAIANKGGIRRGLPKGTVTEGQIISMLPFNNYIVVLDIKGSDLIKNFEVMIKTAGNGLSSEADVVYDPIGKRIVSATIDGKPIDPDSTYRIATIDYLANGGDYMEPLKNGKVVFRSDNKVYNDLLTMLTTGKYRKKTIKSENRVRMRPVAKTVDLSKVTKKD